MNLLAALFSGILAAFTPCVIVLIPALLYRFSGNEKKPLIAILQFVISFLLVYVVSALFLSELFSSAIRYGLQLGIGLLFVVLGTLALLKRFNPLQFGLIKNPFLFGLVFALVVSVNPCVFAYLGLLFSTTATVMLIPNMLLFAIGILLPSLVFALFGKTLLYKVRKASKVMHHITQGMNILLIIMGAYMMYTIRHLEQTDILVTGLLLVITFIIVLRSFFFLQGLKRFKRTENIILFIALLLILFSAVFHCATHLRANTQKNIDAHNPFHIDNIGEQDSAQPTCSSNVQECHICTRCVIVFAGATVLGFIAIALTHSYNLHSRKNKKN